MRLVFALFVSAFLLQAASPYVRVENGRLVDPDGRALMLKGTNLGNWLVPEGYMFLFEKGPESWREIDALFRDLAGESQTDRFWSEWRSRYITETDIAKIASLGLNTVRVPMHWRLLERGGEGWKHLDNVIAWSKKHKIWVILDLHAAQGGQTGTNIDDSWGYPWLFEDEAAQSATLRLWRNIAERYRDEPAVLGYDLLNEPIPHFGKLPSLNPKLEPLYRKIVSAIREVDRNHIVILEGTQWASKFDSFGPPFDGNSMYSFHKYWTAPTCEVIEEYLAYSMKHNVPLLMGESGENSDEWISKFRHTLDAAGVHWTFWPWKKMLKTSAPVSFGKPIHWDAIVAYSQLPGGVGAAEKKAALRPTPQQAREALADLLEKIRFQSCALNKGYVQALGLRTSD